MLFDQPDARHALAAGCLVVDDTCAIVSCAMRLPDERGRAGAAHSGIVRHFHVGEGGGNRHLAAILRAQCIHAATQRPGGLRRVAVRRLHVRPTGRLAGGTVRLPPASARCLREPTTRPESVESLPPSRKRAGRPRSDGPVRVQSHAALCRKSPPRQPEDQSWPTNSRTTGASLGSCMAMCIVARTRPALLPQSKRVPSKR